MDELAKKRLKCNLFGHLGREAVICFLLAFYWLGGSLQVLCRYPRPDERVPNQGKAGNAMSEETLPSDTLIDQCRMAGADNV